MDKINAGALVIYRAKPAFVTAIDGDRIELKTPNGETKRVRIKDIEFVHAGNGSAASFPLPRPPEPDLDEAVELMDGETLSFADFTSLLFDKYAPAECCAAYQILQDGVYFSGSVPGGYPHDARRGNGGARNCGEQQDHARTEYGINSGKSAFSTAENRSVE